MKIVDFVPTFGARSISTGSTISVSKKGVIAFSKGTCELLSLQPKDEVIFSNDKDIPTAWYIRKGETKGDHKIILRKNASTDTSLHANCSSVSLEIFKNLKFKAETNTVRMLIGKEPEIVDNVKYYPIILSSAR